MGTSEQLAFLERELQGAIDRYTHWGKIEKRKATWFRMSTIVLSGAIPILLSLQQIGVAQIVLTNVALGIGIVVTLINAYDARFDHRSLWIAYQITKDRLYALRLDLDYHKAGVSDAGIEAAALEAYRQRLAAIIESSQEEWVRIRRTVQPEAHRQQAG